MPPKILICDNEAPIRALVRASLAGEDYTLLEATSGDEALAAARRERPDMLVLDMMMPGLSGLDVIRELRADPALADVRVLLLTARTQVDDRAAADAAGADRFLAKPFSPAELKTVVAEMTGERR